MSLNTASSRPLPGAMVEDATVSAVSWAAVFAGAVGAVAVSVILIELGLGLGIASASPWTRSGATLATLGVMGGVWLVIAQWISAGIGGYLAGRLRTKWVGVHTDEVFFRDTAHGFLAWSLATVIGVLLIAAGSASLINAGGRAAGAAAGGAAAVAGQSGENGRAQTFADPYFGDQLLRPAPPSATATTGAAAPTDAAAPTASTPTATPNGAAADDRGRGDERAIAVRIFARDLPSGNLTQDDRAYLTQIVAARTGLSQAEAAQRVDATVAQAKSAEDQAKQVADKARKAAAFGSIATALAMAVGAFIASVAAALGGRLRDEYHV
jgi:hypothetical protein